jgi:hypothetical protein
MSTPNCMIIGFLEVYEELTYSLIVLPIFLEYLMNADNWSVVDLLHQNPQTHTGDAQYFIYLWTWELDIR